MTSPASLYDEPLLYQMLHDEWQGDLGLYGSLAAHVDDVVLECGVGVGRLALALARRGHRVHGVDREEAMLATLSRRLEDEPEEVRRRVTFDRADVTTMRLGQRFPLALVPFNGLSNQLDLPSLRAFLAGIREHLTGDGLLGLDIWIPSPRLLAGVVSDSPRFRHPRTGAPVRATERTSYDPLRQVLTIDLEVHDLDGETPELRRLELRQLFPEETRLLLETEGFDVVHRSTSLSPWEGPGAPDDVRPGAELLAFVCRRR